MNNKHDYLIKTIFIVIICGLILGYAGNYILYTSFNKTDNNITTCDRDLLSKIANRNGQPGYNGYILSFTGQIITFFGVLFLLLLSSLFTYNKSSDKSVIEPIKSLFKDALPIFVTLSIITYSLYINIKFKEQFINLNFRGASHNRRAVVVAALGRGAESREHVKLRAHLRTLENLPRHEAARLRVRLAHVAPAGKTSQD